MRHSFAAALIIAVTVQTSLAAADQIPDGLSQDTAPNHIACLMAVDDAKVTFLQTLQIACLKRMIEICNGQPGATPESEVVNCINFETRRGIDFLQAAVAVLPETVSSGGFFERSYTKRRGSILGDLEGVMTSPAPKSIDAATQQSIALALSASMLFYLARETRTPLDAIVAATFDYK